MQWLFLFLCLPVINTWASVTGMSTYPISREQRVFSASTSAFMGPRREMGAGLRYTQKLRGHEVMDLHVASAQHEQSLVLGGGLDFGLVEERARTPRLGIKPFILYENVDDKRFSVLGVAPSVRKGLVLGELNCWPYLAAPMGLKINSSNDEFVYYASVSLGVGLPLPWQGGEKWVLNTEANMNFGGSTDYLGFLISYLWN